MKIVKTLMILLVAGGLAQAPITWGDDDFDDFDLDALLEDLAIEEEEWAPEDEDVEAEPVDPDDEFEDFFDEWADEEVDEWEEPEPPEEPIDDWDDWDDFEDIPVDEPEPEPEPDPDFMELPDLEDFDPLLDDLFIDEFPEDVEEDIEELEPEEPEVWEPEEEDPVEPDPDMTPEEWARERAYQEEIRRQAREVEGYQALQAGGRAMRAREYEQAREQFQKALDNIPDRPATRSDLARVRQSLAEAHYRVARDIVRDDGDLRVARQNVNRALALVPDHRGATTLTRRIAREEARRRREAERPVPVEDRPEIVEKRELVEELLREGRKYFDAGEYDRAERLYEAALLRDEYNIEAMRFLRRIDEVKMDAASRDREAAAARMMREVREAWAPPRHDEVDLPPGIMDPRPVDDVTAAERLRQKMSEIIIPRIEFREANIRDVISFLVDASERLDPEREGVNIILHLPGTPDAPARRPPAPERRPDPADPWGDWDVPAPTPRVETPGVRDIPSITLNLRRISLMEAIRYITEVAGLRYRLEDRAVVITSPDMVTGIITRLYPVQPSFLDIISEREEPADRPSPFAEFGERRDRPPTRREDVKDFFERAGVPFPPGTSITYNPAISQLIVANTPENLDRFERILAQLNVVPSQVEIEARFVEVAQSDLRELGLQWILTDNYQFMQRRGGGPLATREHVQIDADPRGVTQGLRFFGQTAAGTEPISRALVDTPTFAGSILSMSSVLTNPELQVVLHALAQDGNVDVLSAPRVTTRSGVNAQIQVVSEIIYPTEFDIEPAQTRGVGELTMVVTPPTVTPRAFDMRRTGVILNVTPTVGPDGYTIDLALSPEVAELVDWLQYGSTITIDERDFTFNLPQPVFASRNVTTSIVIWDGQTVVMGGLIRERLVQVRDKIPILGDIPLLGRLFRTDSSKSRKENLLIFVTARLVDPAGKPIHRAEAMTMPGVGLDLGEP